MATLAVDSAPNGKTVRTRFVANIFVGSFLLFLVQPMIARMALPRLGGAPTVWNSAMLVYQALLLAGYAYAHWLGRLKPRGQAGVHLIVLALAGLTLPIGLIGSTPPPNANPFLWVPWLLLVSIGPLFFAVSAQAPLLQRWFALSDAGDPYPLYAASNLGSFGGLLAYPFIVEPLLGVTDQRWLWSVGYGLLVLLVAWCGLRLPKSVPAQTTSADTPAPDWRTIGKWIALAAVPSGLILSTTLHITTDMVAMPLLWVLPLGVYLLSFTVAFAANRSAANWIIRLAPLILLFGCFGVFIQNGWLVLVFGAISILNVFTVSVALHSRLFETRPPAEHLTFFYLMMSVGGVLGGAFCALIAPLIFNWTYEYLLLLVGAAALMHATSPFDRLVKLWDGSANARRITPIGILAVFAVVIVAKTVLGHNASGPLAHAGTVAILTIAIFAIGNRALFTAAVAALLISAGGWEKLAESADRGMMTRSFFGIYEIRPGANNSRMLVHGTTIHGIQNLGSPERERMETSYYAPLSGVGLAMRSAADLFGPNARVGIVGLGAGTLSCYARPGQAWTFYEIDPAVSRIAGDPTKFTFVARCKPDAQIRLGDARLLIERAPAASTDLLVLDAFSSDSVPMHLLTREAFADYRRILSPNGLLMVHISNRYLDLKPVVAAAARSGGWTAALRRYRADAAGVGRNETGSDWVALSQNPATVGQVVKGEEWLPLTPRSGFKPWTDDHASVLPLIDFGKQ
jgi:hypothetical protein